MTTVYVALYSRVSTDEQNKGTSPEEQIKKLRTWTREKDFEIATYIDDDGYTQEAVFMEDFTGFEWQRPEMDKIRKLAQLKVFHLLVVTALDRYARDMFSGMMLDKEFKRCGIRLYSLKEGEFTNRNLSQKISALLAEEDAQNIKQRLREGRRALAEQGFPNAQGKAAYGYVKQGVKRNTVWTIVEDQAEIVRLIYYWYIEDRIGPTEIARRLNAENVPSPSKAKGIKSFISNDWTPSGVNKILRNSTYTGKLIAYQWKKSYDGGAHQRRDESEHVVIDVPVIIDSETYETAQELMREGKRLFQPKSAVEYQYLLSGLLTCGCGYKISATTLKADNKKRKYHHYYYRCNSTSENMFRKNCGLRTLDAIKLDSIVWDFCERLLTDTRGTVEKYKQAQESINAANEEAHLYIKAIDELLLENERDYTSLQEKYFRAKIEEDFYDFQRGKMKEERIELERQRQEWIEKIQELSISDKQIDKIEKIGNELNNTEDEIPFERKRKILEKLKIHGTITWEMENDVKVRVLYLYIYIHSWRLTLDDDNAQFSYISDNDHTAHGKLFVASRPLVFRIVLPHKNKAAYLLK